MLSARKDNRTIFTHQYSAETLKDWSRSKQLTCPDCRQPVIFKTGDDRESHFAHLSKDCSFPFREPETIEHEKGKMKIYHWLSRLFGEEACKVEQHIPSTNQRADTFLLSSQTAVEFQCSPIQPHKWEQRHKLYKEAGVRDFWILGYSMHTYAKKNHAFLHKLNQLEKTLLAEYDKLFYYDTLSEQFVILHPLSLQQNTLHGHEYFFKATECLYDTNEATIKTKYDFFMSMQEKRRLFSRQLSTEAQKTDSYLKQTKRNREGPKTLASKKQIRYIQFLLAKHQMTSPYKLHGLLRHEASAIIDDLLQKEQIKKDGHPQ